MDPLDEFYFRAYDFLSSNRGVGMAMGPIPGDSIIAYAERYGYSDPEALFVIISVMDSHVRKWSDEQQEKRRRSQEDSEQSDA